jgi:hypothetical protein
MRIVQYHKQMEGEEPFILGGIKWVFCWGKYPDNKVDVAVYRFSHDLAYYYDDFREAMGINQSPQKLNKKKLSENMETSIKEKVIELKSIQAKLDEALKLYKASIKDLESTKNTLVPEVMEAFKGQTEGAEKLKISIDGMLVEIVQESEKLTTSYKDAFDMALTKVNENTRKVMEQILENSKVASKVKGQMKIDRSKVYEGVQEMFGKVKEWLGRAYEKITNFSGKAQEGIDEIETMIRDYEEREGNKYATPNMDDVESGAITENKSKRVSEKTSKTPKKRVSESGSGGDADYQKQASKYRFFVVSDNKIKSGWEFKEDALEIADDHQVKSLAQVKKSGLLEPFLNKINNKSNMKKESIKTVKITESQLKSMVIKMLTEMKEGIHDKDILSAPHTNVKTPPKGVGDYDPKQRADSLSRLQNFGKPKVEENEGKQVSEKTRQTLEKWISGLGHRGAAVKLVDYFIRKMTGALSSSDLADTATFSNGLDEIEDNLNDPSDYYYALIIAKETAEEMLSDEGFGSDMFDEGENQSEASDDTEFVAHGTYTVSNTGGYEVMLSDSGDMAKVRDAFGSDNPKTSEWLEIEYIDNEETGEQDAVIDPNGYNIPLDMVMKVNEGESWMETRAGANGKVFESVSVKKTDKKDDHSRPIYKGSNGKVYVDVSLGKGKKPDLHSVTKSGEPDTPLNNFEIEDEKLNEVIERYKKIINY